MDALAPTPRRLPQRVVVAGPPGPLLSSFLERLAGLLDVPLVPLTELDGPAEAARLAEFDGWVTTSEYDDARALLLDRADFVLHVEPEVPGTLRSLVRRTVRRIRAEPSAPVADWVDAVPVDHPHVTVVRLAGPDELEGWLSALSA